MGTNDEPKTGDESTPAGTTGDGAVVSAAKRAVGVGRRRLRSTAESLGTAAFWGGVAVGWVVLTLAVGPVADATLGAVAGSTVAGSVAFVAWVALSGWLFASAFYARRDERRRVELADLDASHQPADVPALLDGTGESYVEARAFAARGLSKVPEDHGPSALVRHVDGGATEVVDRLAPLLDDPNRNVQTYALNTFAALAREYPEPTSAVGEDLVSFTRSSDPDRRRPAVSCVAWFARPVAGAMDAETAAEVLADHALNDEMPEIRYEAVGGLALLGTERAVEVLEAVAEGDTNAEVRTAARERLSDLTARAGADESSEADGWDPDDLPDAPSLDGSEERGGDAEGSSDAHPDPSARYVQPAPDLDFDDVVGLDEVRSELRRQVIEPFTDADTYDEYGVGAQQGVLLYGAPGTGKTHLARCLAGELGLTYLEADVGSVDSKFVGEGSQNVARVFEEAGAHRPSLVFLDEIDALAGERGAGDQHHESQKMVNQLLSELSDLDDEVLVVAATNHPDDVDEAMLRTGRFDAKVEVTAPGPDDRVALLDYHLDAPTAPLDDEAVASATAGFVASDVAEVARRAARAAATRAREGDGETRVTEADVLAAAEAVADDKSEVGSFVESPPDLDFGDVAGMDGLKTRLRESVIEPLENPEYYEEYGIDVANGFLLYGPPGTGKTHVTRCLAGELGIDYVGVDASDLVSKWIGEGAENVAAMFDEARANQPCLVFVDEIDALASDRESGRQQKSERQMVNQFLTELSAVAESDDEVVVVGATNQPDRVDDAMLRTGRLGTRVEVPAPDADARVGIFYQHLDAPHADLDDAAIAEETAGLVASDLEAVATEAAMRAMQRAREGGERTDVTQRDVVAAVERVRGSERAYGG
jgi:SpoVK/Ycf46/Vps4 family AAA+-type ATPase